MKYILMVICLVAMILAACSQPPQVAPPVAVTASTLPPTPTLEARPTPTQEASPTPTLETRPTPTQEGSPTPALPSEVRAYLDEALDILQANSLYRKQIDWPAFRAQMVNVARNAKTIPDTYDVIEIALLKLGDDHGRVLTPGQVTQVQDGTADRGPGPEGRLLEERFGYVLLPRFNSADQGQQNQYATAVQDVIREVDTQSPCGWIVDLRSNTGGSGWPMLAGIGPILGEGQVGAFIDPDGKKTYWYYDDGQARLDDRVGAESTQPAYQLRVPAPPVAVLTGNQTRSAGESIAVAFRERPTTRSFGQATGGFTTGVAGFPLSDGAMILLAANTYGDRAGHVYEGPILPDETVTDSDPDAALQAAQDWLRAQPACAN